MIIMTVIGFWISWVPAIHPQWIDRLTDSLAAGAVGLTASAAVMLSAKLVSNSVGIVLAFIGMAGGIFSETKAWMLPLLLFFGGITSVLMNMPLFTASEPHQERLALLNVEQESATEMKHVSKKISIGFGLIWIVFLVIALIGQTIHDNIFMQLFSTFYLIGTLIFGGGPVVIPMIQGFMGQHGWMTDNEFMAGLAVISLLPGPMFNISAFCGTIALRNLSPLYRVIGAIISWLAIFSPGLFLKVMILPFWQTYRSLRLLQIFFNGVNAIAVGLVYGSVYLLSDKNLLSNSKPLMHSPKYVIISGFAFVAFGPLKMPAPLVVLLSGVLGMLPYW
jgi:chromate transport protein ChrA